MEDNKRDSTRLGLVVDIQLTCDDGSQHMFKSRNISDTGVFLEYNDEQLELPIGENVVLQVSSMLGDEPPPPVKSVIARITKEGLGLKFIL